MVSKTAASDAENSRNQDHHDGANVVGRTPFEHQAGPAADQTRPQITAPAHPKRPGLRAPQKTRPLDTPKPRPPSTPEDQAPGHPKGSGRGHAEDERDDHIRARDERRDERGGCDGV